MKIKRLLAFVISVAMIVGMVPTFVFAKEIDLEADEPETTQSSEAEEEDGEEPEEKEEPAESEDKDEPESEEDEPSAEEPDEVFEFGEKPSEVPSETDSKAALGGRIGKSKVYWTLSGSTLTVYGKGKMPAWKSAESVPWHAYRSQIHYIYVRAGVSSIGNHAFRNIHLDGGRVYSRPRGKYALKSIGAYAFYGTNANVFNFKTLKSIGAHAYENSGQRSITLPKNVKSLGAYAFANNPYLTYFKFNKKIKTIPTGCFEYAGFTSVSIPKKIKTIGAGAYFACTSLTRVTFGKNVKTIGKEAFMYCQNLSSVTIPKKVTKISEGLFAYSGLASVKMHGKITSIGPGAFFYCSKLTSVSIPKKVKSIGTGAFSLTGITSVTIPGNVKTIGNNAFGGSALSELTLCSGIQTIGDTAFKNTVIKSVVIPGSVTSIGKEAFYGTRLSSVKLNYGLKSIGQEAFGTISTLKAISIPSSVTNLGFGILSGCSGVAVTYVPELRTQFPDAFTGIAGTPSFIDLKENTIAVTGKLATVKAKKVKKKAQKIAAAKLYTFTEPGIGGHLFAKVSGNKKIAVASNGVITVKKKLKKGTYTVRVKVMATGDLEHRDSGWQIITVKVKVK
ncbi:MAG: leucine-rich repeat domain-containing protein [Saccharofermentans sp.]|nr:leucine-rich repeat domain-containing protein [Saccharofermentans sp.]